MSTDFKVDSQKLEVTIERTFKAPIERIWQAHTDSDLVAKWWGPRDLKTVIDKLEVRPGGQWRILHQEAGGKEHWFHGQYSEVVEPTKLSRTFVYEPMPDQVMNENCFFEPIDDNQTKLTIVTKFPSREALDWMVSSGMEYGSRQSIDRLAELVEK